MDTIVQLMMGVSLAACAGLRTWMPMLVMGIMARTGHYHLNPAFAFLARTDVLIVFSIAAALETVGDKIIAIDHLLDAVGTIARPIAGTLLASSALLKLDPGTATLLGLIAGGSVAFTIHSGKAVARANVSALSPFHGGLGNAFVSVGEDVFSIIGVFVAIFAPIIAFFFTVFVLAGAIALVILGIRTGKKLFTFVKSRRQIAPPASP